MLFALTAARTMLCFLSHLESEKSFLSFISVTSLLKCFSQALKRACALRPNQCSSYQRLSFPKLYNKQSGTMANSHYKQKMAVTTRLRNIRSFISNLIQRKTLWLLSLHSLKCPMSLCAYCFATCASTHMHICWTQRSNLGSK